MIFYGTDQVSSDEPCLGLYELELLSPDHRSWRRYQIIIVMRGDRPTEFRKDLGEADGKDQFRIPGGAMDNGRFYIEHNVGELVEIADQLRACPFSRNGN